MIYQNWLTQRYVNHFQNIETLTTIDIPNQPNAIKGKELKEAEADDIISFAKLLEMVALVSPQLRVRFSTSHPKDMTDDLINIYKKSTKLMPLVHLPVQSGSNKILKLMNRKHTIEEYLKVYESLKEINPNVEFSSDFIIGYPGEDEDDFNKTMELIEKIGFINSYSFIFSARPGTVAADLTQVNAVKSKERLEIIQKRLFENQIKKNKSLENKILNVLVENIMKDGIKLFGRTEYMTSVIFDGDIDNIGKIVQVEITSSNQNSLFGKLVESSKKKVA